MGSSKGRRGSGASLAISPQRLEQHEAEGGWRGRVKVLASSTFGAAATKEKGGRAVALTEEDFRKSGFRARDLVAVLAGPTRLVAGRVFPLPSAALRPGGVGLTSASAQSLLGGDGENTAGAGGGARVRVRRLSDTSVAVLEATTLNLVLEAGVGINGGRGGGGGGGGGVPTAQPSPHAYLKGLAPGRKALLMRAVGYCSRGAHAREGDLFSVSFEGVPHVFRAVKLEPPALLPRDRQDTATNTTARAAERTKESSNDGGDALATPLGKLSISKSSVVAETERSKSAGWSAAAAPPPSPPPAASENEKDVGALKAEATGGDDGSGAGKTTDSRTSGQAVATAAAKERLEAFYREHNPEKLNGGDVDGILAKYAGREETLFAKLEKKYGAGSSVLRTAAAGGNIGTERQQQKQPSSSAPTPDRPTTPGARPPFPGQQPLSARDLDRKPAGGRPPPATPSAKQQDAEAVSCGGGLGGDDAAGIRSWGAAETLWVVGADTSIQVSGADAPPDDDRVIPAPPPENLSTNVKLSGPVEGGLGDGLSRPKADAGGGGDGGGTRQDKPYDGEGGDWGSVGGLSSQIEQLREAIELPLSSPEVLQSYGVRPPRGVLLHGPPGTGKTTLARAAAKACGCHVIVVNGSELMSRFVGESEGALRRTFAEASRRAPCLIVFDEVDTLCPRRDQASSEAQRRVVSTMLALLDGVDAQERVVVIACTNRPQALDPALRRPGRLDSEVEVGVPDAAGRAEILRVLLRGVPHAMTGDTAATSTNTPSSNGGGGAGEGHSQSNPRGGVADLAARTHGFVGADLQLLVKEAALQALRRTRATGGGVGGGLGGYGGGDGGRGERRELDEQDRRNRSSGNSLLRAETRIGRGEGGGAGAAEGGLATLTPEDFRAALPLVSPSGLREVAVEVPSVKWGDIGGMEGVKQSLREVVEWPLRHPEAFLRMGMSPPRGVLLYGPPGCSKTLMARALATESGMNFLAVKGPELLSKWLGESERAMQALFKRARAAAPTIIFFDEVDALACKRGGGGEGGAGATERVLTQLLTELDGIQPVKRLVVVAATNRPDVIDPALLRPGRLDRLVYVPPPDTASRLEILRLSLAKVPCGGDVDRELLARRTEGFSGAEVVALCRDASICALEEDRSATQVRQTHLLEALGQMRPQITPAVLASYASFQGGGREDSGSHFLEPQTSIASTLSIGADSRERDREGDSLNPRTFDDDTASSSSEEEDCRHDQRADLLKMRMMSRRNFAVADGTGLRHRVTSSARVEERPDGGHGSGGHARRRTSVKKKVHDLGELPALDWSNASAKLLVMTAVVGIFMFSLYSGYMDEDDCVQLGKFCLREWLNGLCIAIGAYFVIELLAKAVAGFFKWTRLLHTNNKVWIFIKLHKDVSLLIWSAIIYLLWTWFKTTGEAPKDDGVISKILGCFLAYTATHVVSEMCKVEMAHRYMWRPYLERARASIWSQYVIFMMTDYAMGLKTKDAEGQALALGFTKTKKGGDHLSLYTVGKAIGFVHANALRHPLGPGRPGTDQDGMIDSKTGARLFGGLLFDALMMNFNEEEAGRLLPVDETVAFDDCEARGNKATESKTVAVVDPVPLPRPFSRALAPSTAGTTVNGGGNSNGFKSPLHRKLSLVEEEEEQKRETATTANDRNAGGVDVPEEVEDHADENESTSTEDADKWSAAAAAAGGTGDPGSLSATSTGAARWPINAAPTSCATAKDKELAGGEAPGTHRRSGGNRRGSACGGPAAANGEGATGGGGGRKGIKLGHLRKMTSKSIALKIMELFEVAPDGVVSRKEFVDRIVDIFVQRRSLQLTLADYEAILTKVGYLISVVSIFVVAFICFRILGFNIGSLILTWLSLGVAFSFLFGSSASAFFESIIFVFVTKAYDVGDPVFFVDDTGGEDWYVVTRINMLTTVFRRWDGEATLIANNLLAKKAIRNQWRSSPYLHHTMISVSADTPMEKLDQMKAGIAAGLRRGRHRHRHGLGGLMPDTVDYSVKGLADGNRLSIFVCCRQKENSANMGRRFGNSSFFLKLLVRECNRHGISYTLPPQPLITRSGGGGGPEAEAVRTREAFLGGKLGSVDTRR
eukprot:g9262.t1